MQRKSVKNVSVNLKTASWKRRQFYMWLYANQCAIQRCSFFSPVPSCVRKKQSPSPCGEKILHMVQTFSCNLGILIHWQVEHIAGNFPISQIPCNPISAERMSPCYWPYCEQSTQRPPRSWVKNRRLCSNTSISNWILGSLSKPITDWISTLTSSTLVLIPINPERGWPSIGKEK